jgi:chaperonin GroES
LSRHWDARRESLRSVLVSARTSSSARRGGAMTIRPLHDRIVARRIVEQDKTKGGLFIPDNAKEKPLEAVVIAVGSGKRLDNGSIQAITVKAGDKILIGKYTGSEVKLDGQEHIILSEDDVLAVLEG